MHEFPPVEQLLPHRRPMIVVDRIVAADDRELLSETQIDDSHPLFDAAACGLPGWAIIELMAQTVGLHGGLLAQRSNEPVRIGYLLGTRRLELARPGAPAGSTVRVNVRLEFLDPEGIGSYQCDAWVNGEVFASARVNVYRQRDGEIPE